jgi:hypothetical protein
MTRGRVPAAVSSRVASRASRARMVP